jgi:hypothetical protein
MKEHICGVLAYPYVDRYSIHVARQSDRFHLPTSRIYSARYTEPKKVKKLLELFLKINAGLQRQIITERISSWSN